MNGNISDYMKFDYQKQRKYFHVYSICLREKKMERHIEEMGSEDFMKETNQQK